MDHSPFMSAKAARKVLASAKYPRRLAAAAKQAKLAAASRRPQGFAFARVAADLHKLLAVFGAALVPGVHRSRRDGASRGAVLSVLVSVVDIVARLLLLCRNEDEDGADADADDGEGKGGQGGQGGEGVTVDSQEDRDGDGVLAWSARLAEALQPVATELPSTTRTRLAEATARARDHPYLTRGPRPAGEGGEIGGGEDGSGDDGGGEAGGAGGAEEGGGGGGGGGGWRDPSADLVDDTPEAVERNFAAFAVPDGTALLARSRLVPCPACGRKARIFCAACAVETPDPRARDPSTIDSSSIDHSAAIYPSTVDPSTAANTGPAVNTGNTNEWDPRPEIRRKLCEALPAGLTAHAVLHAKVRRSNTTCVHAKLLCPAGRFMIHQVRRRVEKSGKRRVRREERKERENESILW